MCASWFEPRGKTSRRSNGERGVALLLALVALLILSAIGVGMMYMSNTETSINVNYRDTQVAFVSMRAGLEEARDRMRSNNSNAITKPTAMPGAANSLLYILNPAGSSDVVDPTSSSNPYFDDELCHETFSGLNLSNPGANIPCTAGPPSSSVVTVNSVAPFTNTASALKYKWVRISLKQNATISNAEVDPSQSASTQVCWEQFLKQEIPLSAVPGGPYTDCMDALGKGASVAPIYLVTSLAVTPSGSRRIGQYEVAGMAVNPPPVALGLDGPSAQFTPRPSSANYAISGNDSGASGYSSSGGVGSCVPIGPATVPAISTGDSAGQTTISTALQVNPNRSGNYTGSGGTPSVVNQGPTGTGQFSGGWSTPSALDALVNSLANAADVTYNCGIGSPCTPSGPVGTNATPQITYVSGDFNFGNGSGAGVLVVTGTLSFNGNASFNGLILVIGQGIVTESGGGNGGFNGTIFVATTHSSTPPYPELASLAAPLFNWNGGGTSGVQYNSCWATIGNSMHFNVVATREEMY